MEENNNFNSIDSTILTLENNLLKKNKTSFSNFLLSSRNVPLNSNKENQKFNKKYNYYKDNYFNDNKRIYLNKPLIKPSISGSFSPYYKNKIGLFSQRNYENNDYNKTIIRNNYFNKRQLNNSQNRRLFNPKTNNKLLRLSEEEDLFTFSKF